MKVEKRKLSTRRRLNEARFRGARRFYERWGGERDYYDYLTDHYHLDDYDDDDFYLDKYDKVYVYGITEDIPLVVFEDDKKYLAFCEYEAIGRIDSKAKEFFQITDPLDIRSFDLYEFPKDSVIDYNWMKTSAKVASIIKDSTGDTDRLNRVTVADGTPILEALKNLIVEGVEKAYDEGTAEEIYTTYYQHNAIQSDVPELKVDLFYEGELNGEYSKNMKESVKKTGDKMKKSPKRRIEEARARGAKHFYEWDAARDRAWLKAEDSYLDRLAGDLNKPYDDSLEDKYDKVWVHGYTENVPLVVFEGDKKYLASYEYEVAGRIDANAEEVFQLTDALEFITFDLYEFPKAGDIPADWNGKNDVIVASISDDKERLAGITVADGTPVVKALEYQMIKGVEKEYFDGDVEEYYSDDYDPDYDDVELEVDLVYKGELNKKASRDMNESVKKLRDRIKESSKRRKMKEYASWHKIETFDIENGLDDPLKILKDGKEFEGYYSIECEAGYSGDDYDIDEFESDLRGYKLTYLQLWNGNDEDEVEIEGDEINTPENQKLLNSLTVVLDDNTTMPFMECIKTIVEDGVEEHGYDLDIDYWNDWDDVPDIDDEY